MLKKIGIFGGTFNPIHNGHLLLAEAAVKEAGLTKVLFLPNGNPPHKQDKSIVSAADRFKMVEEAIKYNPSFGISDYEIKRAEPSYTIDTYRVMKEKYDCPIYFIIGADSFYSLHTWKAYADLVRECSFIVADRNCSAGSDLNEACKKHTEIGGSVVPLSFEPYDVTSTQIRDFVKQGKDISDYVPVSVENYIFSNKLYQP